MQIGQESTASRKGRQSAIKKERDPAVTGNLVILGFPMCQSGFGNPLYNRSPEGILSASVIFKLKLDSEFPAS